MIMQYLKLMRVHHYIKNLLIFAALTCGGQFFVQDKLISAIIGFVTFCMISSIVYIINDIQDKEKDRLHPVKCKRPIASGTVSIKNAIFLVCILMIIAAICNWKIFRLSSTFLLIIYLVINLAYSFGLKNIPLVDVTILVSGFLIRVIYGAIITGMIISNWLYLTVIAVSFYFALGKRRNELKKLENNTTRRVLKAYPVNFLDKSMYMCLTLANAFYALWSMDKNTITFYKNDYLIFTIPIVLLITMRYSMDVEGESDGDPVEVLVHDKSLLILCIVYIAVMFSILYL